MVGFIRAAAVERLGLNLWHGKKQSPFLDRRSSPLRLLQESNVALVIKNGEDGGTAHTREKKNETER